MTTVRLASPNDRKGVGWTTWTRFILVWMNAGIGIVRDTTKTKEETKYWVMVDLVIYVGKIEYYETRLRNMRSIRNGCVKWFTRE
jgi:hypothetical protein